MQDLEVEALEKMEVEILFYYRYVDDILLAEPPNLKYHTLNIFNSFHSRFQFTMEVGSERINFLDVTMIINNNTIEFNLFHKATLFSGRYLNFLSQHPISQKRRTFIGLTDSAFLFFISP